MVYETINKLREENMSLYGDIKLMKKNSSIMMDALEEIAELTMENCFDCPSIAQKALADIQASSLREEE